MSMHKKLILLAVVVFASVGGLYAAADDFSRKDSISNHTDHFYARLSEAKRAGNQDQVRYLKRIVDRLDGIGFSVGRDTVMMQLHSKPGASIEALKADLGVLDSLHFFS